MTQRHFLFIQAPFGRFSRDLAQHLRARGHRVTRVIFNGGDLLDWRFGNAHLFWAPTGRFPAWIKALYAREGVTDIITYGDGHYYTDQAIAAAEKARIAVNCLEQGYLRPNWITLDAGGVNGRSGLPRDPDFYRSWGIANMEIDGSELELGSITKRNVFNIITYSLVFYFSAPFFPFYRSPVYMPGYVTGLAHLVRYLGNDKRGEANKAKEEEFLKADWPFYLALMQRPGDSQILCHSAYPTVRSFYLATLQSFARSAPADHHLVFKCHPLDQGLSRHAARIAKAARKAGVADRVHFIDGGHLPSLARRSSGVVTVNSTAGVAALSSGIKTKALGEAVYNLPGLTYEGDLDSFWTAETAPDPDLFSRYRQLMAEMTQVTGSYSTETGMRYAIDTLVERLIAGPLTEDAIIQSRSMAQVASG
ncbi:MAG: hypothetical protein AAFY02_17720 [Pseudomonadota bacterium]